MGLLVKFSLCDGYFEKNMRNAKWLSMTGAQSQYAPSMNLPEAVQH